MKEDKRILKTKKNLKDTFVKMLSLKSFEQITVKELCQISNTSRITFYTHYSDKYDLMDDISEDMIKMARVEYQDLQRKNNPLKDSVISYCNFLDCILNIYYKNIQFFSHTSNSENPYLSFSFYKYILKYLEIHTKKRSDFLRPKYSIKKISSFLCYGLWGFINQSHAENCSVDTVRKEIREILQGILYSEILTINSKKLEKPNKKITNTD